MTISTAVGFGTGLNLRELSEQLVSAQRSVRDNSLNLRESIISVEVSGLATLTGAVDTFLSSIEGIETGDSFEKTTVSVEDSTIFTASVDSEVAAAGRYDIEVEQLAQAHSIRSNAYTTDDDMGTGTLTIGVAGDTFDIELTGENTLSEIRDAINDASDNTGVSASILTSSGSEQLILTSDETGASNTITVSQTDGTGNISDLVTSLTANVIETAMDAQIDVDGVTVTSSTNSFSDFISGIDLTVKEADVGTSYELTVNKSKTGTEDQVEDLVSAYNTLMGVIDELGAYDVNTGAQGELFSDMNLQSVKTGLNRVMFSVSEASSTVTNITQLGLSLNSVTGDMELDSSTLSDLVSSDFNGITDFLSGDDGLAASLRELLESYTGTNGILTQRLDSLDEQLTTIAEDRIDLNVQMASLQQSLFDEFVAMDSAVALLNSTSEFLTTNLANLPGFSYNES